MIFTSAGRDLTIVATCTGVSFAGDFLAEVALTLTLQARGASGLTVAALLLAGMVPLVALAPVAGRVADRYSSRAVLVAVGTVQVAVCAALAFVSSPVAIVALTAVLASGVAVTGPTMSALVPKIVGLDRLPKAQATIQTVRGVGILAGPALAGVLVGAYGPRLPLLVDAASFVAVVAAGLLLRTVRRGGPLEVDATTGRVVGGLTVVRRDALLTGVLVFLTAAIAAASMDNVAEVFLIRGPLHATTTGYGLLTALWSAAAIAGTWLVGRRTPSDRGLVAVMVGTVVTIGAVTLAMAGVPSVGWLVPVYVVGGLANGAINLVVGVLVGRRVPDEVRGRVGAVFGGVANGGTVVGFAAAGLLLAVVPPRTLLGYAGATVLVFAVLLTVPVLRAAFRAPARVEPAAAATVGS